MEAARVRSCAGAARRTRVAPISSGTRTRTRFLLAVAAALTLATSVPAVAPASEEGATPVCAPTGSEQVSTSEPRYPQGGVADINGAGFAADCVVSVRVTWPDGSVQTGDGSGTAGSDWVRADADGNFVYLYQLGDVGGEYVVDVLGENGAVLAQTTFYDAAVISTLKLGSAAGPENYIYTAGDTIHAQGTVDSTRFYKWFVINSAGTTVRETSCAGGAAGAQSVSDSYTVQASDAESGSVPYTYRLRQFTNNICTTTTTPANQQTAEKFFGVAKAETFSDPTLTTPASSLSVGTQAYVRVKGLRNAGQQNPITSQNDWTVTWIKPDGTTACSNTVAIGGSPTSNDLPDSSNAGLLPTGAGDAYLRYEPNPTATGSNYNRQANYDGACPALATDNTGTWKLKVQVSPTFFVTLPVFTVTCTAPSVTTHPGGQSITYGDDASFTASATGAPTPTVQWELSTDGGSNWDPVPGATSTTLNVNDPTVAQSGHKYRAVFTNSCGGTATATSDAATLTVGKRPLTGNFTADNKVYDGNTDAAVLTRSVTNKVGSDDVNHTGGDADFDTKDFGTAKTVTLVGATLTGADAGNYTLDSMNTTTANITRRPLTGNFTADNKVYDGNTDATVLTRSVTNKVGTEDVNHTGGDADFDTKNVGTGKTVSLTGATLTGADAGNYTLASMDTASADITARPLDGDFTAGNKVYDGMTDAAVTGRTVTNKVGSEDVNHTGGTATFGNKHVGNGKTVTLTGVTLTGADAGNYTLASMDTAAADISVKSVSGTFAAADKVYDRTNSAAASNRQLPGAVGGDDVSLTGGTAAFNDDNVGQNKAVSLSGATLAGADKDNYSLAGVADAAADITPAPVVGAFTAADKMYDGNTSATITGRSIKSGVVGSDDVTLEGGSAEFTDPEPGKDKQVNGSGFTLGGADGHNYEIDSVEPTRATIQRSPAGAPAPPVIDTTGNCLRRPVLAFVRGKRIKKVVYKLDGEKIGVVREQGDKRRWGIRIDRRELSDGKHKLRAKVYFVGLSRPKPVKLSLTLKPCVDKTTPEAISLAGADAANGCRNDSLLAYVKGGTISRVTYTLNGRMLKKVSVADWNGRYGIEIPSSLLTAKENTLTARLRFIASSDTDPRVLSRELPRCGNG